MNHSSGGTTNRAGVVPEGEIPPPLTSTATTLLKIGIAAVALAGGHILLGLAWPYLVQDPIAAGGLRWSLNLALYMSHLFILGSILLVQRGAGPLRFMGYGIGYALVIALLWPLVWVMTENLLLVVLAAMLYGALLHRPWFLGYLYLFLFCQRFLPAYLYPSFLLAALLYTTLGPFLRAWRDQKERFLPLCHLGGLLLLTGLLLPIVYFCTQSSAQDIQQRIQETEVRSALGTSFMTSATATLVVLILGVPMAYAMVRRSFPGRGLIDTLIDLPIVVPPPIVGIALLAFVGPKAPFGAFMERVFNVQFFDSFYGIVLAQAFVGSPYLIRASMVAFSAVDERYENVSRTLGSSSFSAFARVTMPLSLRGILIGVILTWFRAMAEFGALRIMANHPKTIPILTYDIFNDFRHSESQSVGVLILVLCIGVIIGMWIIRSMPNLLGRSIGALNAAG